MVRIALLLFAISAGKVPLLYGQSDTIHRPPQASLKPVEIRAYFSQQPILGLTTAAQTLSPREIEMQQTTTLLPALNTVPGLRMEERSPGSYRLALRGSLIRSPFGIRNVKIYLDEFPITDAGGNTYLNLIDPASVSKIYILKGPDGSLYGANSGGVIRIQPKGFDITNNQGSLLLSAGSFGLFQEQLSLQRKVNDAYSFSVDQSFTRSDGYRQHSALNKKTLQTVHRWQYSQQSELRLLALYTDLAYETPGGLTDSQMRAEPRMARPASANNLSAADQQAGVQNKSLFGGIANETRFSGRVVHSFSIFGSHTDFENPFITNYEFRKERNLGMRTWISLKGANHQAWQWQMQLGFEGQKGWYSIDNYDNKRGIPAQAQVKDNLNNMQSSLFYRVMIQPDTRWRIESSLSLNQAAIHYRKRFPATTPPEGRINFGDIWMPRLASSYLVYKGVAVRASVSKGFAPPTIAEVRSSDNNINAELKAETGINYEAGVRWESGDRRLIADASLYSYLMENGIVRQLRDNGAEYYVNAGEIRQRGVEIAVWASPLPFSSTRMVRTLSLQAAVTYNYFRFGHYQVAGQNFSGNKVTAVPDWVWIHTISLSLPAQIGLNIFHNYTSEIPLNDANTVGSDPYHLIQIKVTWTRSIRSSVQLGLFAGVDNLLNQRYSLGNDINAFGNRHFNPAPERNYYVGAKISF